MKKVLHIQNGEHDKAGLFQPAMEKAGVELTFVHPWRGEKIPASLQGFDGLSLGGGAQSVYDAEQFPYLADEIKLVQEAAREMKPVNGMCLGAQLIAHALGGRVFKGKEPEFGVPKVSLLPAAAEDALWQGAPGEFTPVSWHGDTFELPPGAVRLASSAITENQLFRYGYGIYGLQFHLEIDAPLLVEMVNADREDLTRSGVDPQAFIEDGKKHLPAVEPIAAQFYANWAALLA